MKTRTGVIRGIPVSQADESIKYRLTRIVTGEAGSSLRVGVRNERGTVYRWILTQGPQQFIDVLAAMIALGFTDEIADAPGRRAGFDAILSLDTNAAELPYLPPPRRRSARALPRLQLAAA